ncbi:trans-acting enoyl reductase family protein [Arthrobacter sp. PAMC25284]|uniref:saccharopine dehydrogenase family protein n=1 Tax=Arthrobacter sp. PAMC25284 TaxID=2861279 RepID=UPI001C626275|nr:saccharopine dehydrogenase NADP-binding domain-containing protein [Arthrobacter sp. PAMC25284]QYF90049.1 saccharopine dehydrogenase NADP-binding domain-containing protein [Arthrobacter sp. PAMC25284]
MNQPLDLIVFGATGFTGRLVAEYLQRTYGTGNTLRWALAGRDPVRLAAVRDAIGADPGLPLLSANAADPDTMTGLAARTRAVLSTVGPYQRHGEALVAACAAAGTDYVDLCGEPVWMAAMIPRLQAPASASGARIVFSCGFDSIPFDLGVMFLQNQAMHRFGEPLVRVRGRVCAIQGGLSGGTIASALATVEQLRRDPAAARTMADPFALTPGFRGPAQPDSAGAEYDDAAGGWTAPFLMAPINTKNVHRTNALRGHPWGRDFVYDERMLTGGGESGKARARRMALTNRLQERLLGFAPSRKLLQRFVLPRPGMGPDARERESGSYELLFIGETTDGTELRARVRGDADPGYGSTSKMISESALCLLQDVDRKETAGGVWTPGAAMGTALLRRLQASAGLEFTIVA